MQVLLLLPCYCRTYVLPVWFLVPEEAQDAELLPLNYVFNSLKVFNSVIIFITCIDLYLTCIVKILYFDNVLGSFFVNSTVSMGFFGGTEEENTPFLKHPCWCGP